LLVVAVTLFFIILIVGISPVFGNAAADAALLGLGYFTFTHVTPPDSPVMFKKCGNPRLNGILDARGCGSSRRLTIGVIHSA
jgi:hypothetical protein